MKSHDSIRSVRWRHDCLRLLDQRKLPFAEDYIDCMSSAEVAQAIRDLVVRGAPAIGISAAWGVVLAAQRGRSALAAAYAQSARGSTDGGQPDVGARSHAATHR